MKSIRTNQAKPIKQWFVSKTSISRLLVMVFGVVMPLASVFADIKMPELFGEHMVLQCGMQVPIWGKATPGERISVKFRDQEKTSIADSNGIWNVKFDPLTAGGPDQLIITGDNVVTIEDVLVGEVWLGSGQSNMMLPVSTCAGSDKLLASAVTAGPYPRLRLFKKNGWSASYWQEATATNTTQFSAMLFSVGLRLQKILDRPVGVIDTACSGSSSKGWISKDAFSEDANCQALLDKYTHLYQYKTNLYQEELAKWELTHTPNQSGGNNANKPTPPTEPTKLQDVGGLYEAFIRPLIPYAIRGVLWDQGEAGTQITGVDQFALMGALIRDWRTRWGHGAFPFIYVQKPSGGGCAWDSTNPVNRNAEKFESLPQAVPTDGMKWEPYLKMMGYTNVAMAISIDLGSGNHPVNKFGYGYRLANVALGLAYGSEVDYYGPIYDSFAIEEDRLRISFSHIGSGLAFRYADKLQGFAIAGADHVFHWATAKLDGNTVVLSSHYVQKPIAARYAWSEKHAWANMFNKDGMPALPFRTDDW